MSDDSEDNYEIGYGRTPKHTRWSSTHQPAKRGRKRGAKGIKTELKALMAREIAFKINGAPSKGLPLPLVLQRMAMDALAGKRNAPVAFIDLVMRVIGVDDLTDEHKTIGAADARLLATYLTNYLADQDADSSEPRHGLAQSEPNARSITPGANPSDGEDESDAWSR